MAGGGNDSRDSGSGAALVIQPLLPRRLAAKAREYSPDADEQLEEAIGLAHAIRLEVKASKIYRLDRPSPSTLLGSGACAEIAAMVERFKPDVVIVNHALSPVQQRNLERELRAKVIDRTGLILEIFGDRAQTKEGRIQVRLAALEYQRSRLVRSWTHLERQRGGLGKTGGPGETQLEIDRRLIVDQIAHLRKELEGIRRNRDLQRRSRERTPFPVVALVGYTNAGKSTLFNRLTGASVFAEDLLFATLDPTMRKTVLANGQDVILSDTVGFIADLPTHLVAAFRATLEQIRHADVILHVRDISNPAHEAQREDVVAILNDLGVDYEHDARVIEVLNKIDALSAEDGRDAVEKAKFAPRPGVAVSAASGEGMEALLSAVQSVVSAARLSLVFELPASDGQALAWLYRHAHIEDRRDEGATIRLSATMEPAQLGRFQEHYGYRPS